MEHPNVPELGEAGEEDIPDVTVEDLEGFDSEGYDSEEDYYK